ncbi:hypothetical protein K227x_63970 [Rubripirellula lacrimiformis]|uniref:Uncharacterized protein n=1 Tax=Rubripirellula lacrimiformis TaxID=1930273 RepID=A0A517NLF1_9BACT|nr:hypothetical protein [Rubripirellula lacrimiformis]QDT07967.1 hypothetical protein K227x_63970 [Rubripirellula lacrimiformis]
MSMAMRPDQKFRDQPSLFDAPAVVPGPAIAPGPVDANRGVDQGTKSRNETYREIASELPGRCRIWLGRIIAAGERGVTLDELSASTGLPANEFSGRITELKRRGMIHHTDQRRPTRKGSTAAVIRATERARQPHHHPQGFDDMTTKTLPPTDLPDAITNNRVPRDQHGDLIKHGGRYLVPNLGRVEIHYDVDADEYFFFRPGRPDQQQPVSMLPHQTQSWELVG